MRIWFYAPFKPPDHPSPSGDRLMANLLISAMRSAQHEVEVISHLRSFTGQPGDPSLLQTAQEERMRIGGLWAAIPVHTRPEIWFTYHPYYRAPDLLGPQIAREVGIAYVTAEASFAGKRDRDAWADFQGLVKDAVQQAAVNFCMTAIDRQGLLRLVPERQIRDLPPFIDVTAFDTAKQQPARNGSIRLVTTAMMRPGVKLQSYRVLAHTLSQLKKLDWRLTVIGDGPERAAVEALFAALPAGRVTFLGEQGQAAVAEHLYQSDVFVWPGIGEAYGLAYLEAQACGVPVCAMACQGVPSVVRDGVSGLLAPDGNEEQFAASLAQLIMDAELRRSLGRSARAFVNDDRSLGVAAKRIDEGLQQAVGRPT